MNANLTATLREMIAIAEKAAAKATFPSEAAEIRESIDNAKALLAGEEVEA